MVVGLTLLACAPAANAPTAGAGAMPTEAAPAAARGLASDTAAPRWLGSFERRVDAIAIADSAGRPYAFPFLGGLNHPRPQLVDIDGDADLDLFVQEYSGRMAFFENVGATGAAQPARWVWRTDRWQNIDIGEWSRFVDVDGDGDLDLLAESPYSFVRVWRNDGGPTRPELRMAVDTLKDVAGTPIFADRQNIPQLADVDCDGQLDLFLGRVDGTITRYEERDRDASGLPRFAMVTDRFEGIQIIGGDAAPGAPMPNMPGAPTPNVPGANLPGANLPTRHGANTMAVVDIDGDGDRDILWGDFFEPGILWIRNVGSCQAPNMRETPLPFPTGDPLRTSGYNAPWPADLDGDGDLDLVVGVLGGAFDPNRTSRDNLYHLEQTAPGQWTVRTARLLDGLDLGNETIPALGDVDGDGDLDLLVGNKIEPGSSRAGALYYLENVGKPGAPSFRMRGTLPVREGYHFAPALGDLDGDGDQDLVLGTWRDELLFYRNEGREADGRPRFTLADSALVKLTRGSHATPTLGDVDADGDLDLVVGEGSGALNYYRNVGSRTAPRFELVSDEWEAIRDGRRSVPRLADLDGDGDLDLVNATESGRVVVRRNVGTRTAPRFSLEEGGALAWRPYAAPAFADLDGDRDLDAFVGNAGGGLVHMENVGAGGSSSGGGARRR